MGIYLSQLNKLWGEPFPKNHPDFKKVIGPVFTDSRKTIDGGFFIPLVGENFDGHDFLDQVYKKGAQATVIRDDFQASIPTGFLHWIVDDTLLAYQQLALLHRKDLNIPVVAVTGSSGKTTTRELIRSVLTPLGSVASSLENNNNDIGVPLTLLQANTMHSAIVVEMGMRGLGQIQKLSFCSHPDIAVITNIGDAHIGLLGNRANIARAKCEITSYLNPQGLVIIPSGDELLEEALSKVWQGRIARVHFKDESLLNCSLQKKRPSDIDFFGKVYEEEGLIEFCGEKIQLPLYGKHNAINLMLSLVVALELGVNLKDLGQLKVSIPSGRGGSALEFGRLIVVDESYNASPEAMKAALIALSKRPGRHFAVLGTMMELGSLSLELHREIAEFVLTLNFTGIVLVSHGLEAEIMSSVLKNRLKNYVVVSSPEDAVKPLAKWLQAEDVLLVKGSRSIGLERLLPLLPVLS